MKKEGDSDPPMVAWSAAPPGKEGRSIMSKFSQACCPVYPFHPKYT
jgi:hypothetical protein